MSLESRIDLHVKDVLRRITSTHVMDMGDLIFLLNIHGEESETEKEVLDTCCTLMRSAGFCLRELRLVQGMRRPPLPEEYRSKPQPRGAIVPFSSTNAQAFWRGAAAQASASPGEVILCG